MADNRYTLSELFQAAFGINSPIYVPQSLNKEQQERANYFGVQTMEPQLSQKTSALGTPVIYPIKFERGTYKRYRLDGSLEEVTKQDYYLPWATVVDFSRAKNITKTRLLGENGTVKELFGFDDWRIRIRGICLADKKRARTAQEELEELLEWEKLADRILVDGIPFEIREIRGITLESLDTPQVMGSPNALPFSITAVSDEIVELQL